MTSKSWILFDTETTGLSAPIFVVELAAQWMRGWSVEGEPFRIRTPLIRLSKADIVRLGTKLKVPYELTLSCYDPVRGRACGRCDACLLRRKGFVEADVEDPTRYAKSSR